MTSKIIAHRGARGLWPENSLDGFRRALALGIAAVEFDVHPTRDGGLAVIHDPLLERTTSGTGPVAERTLDELAALRLKGAEEGVPSFEAVLDVFAEVPVEMHIELKADSRGGAYPGLEEAVLARLAARGLEARAVLTSFLPEVLERLRALRPRAPLLASLNAASAARLGGLEPALETLERVSPRYIAVEKGLLAEEFTRLHARIGAERLGVWTVNEPDEIARWLAMPLATLTTDRPDRALGRA